jgi:hypothetical protein
MRLRGCMVMQAAAAIGIAFLPGHAGVSCPWIYGCLSAAAWQRAGRERISIPAMAPQWTRLPVRAIAIGA